MNPDSIVFLLLLHGYKCNFNFLGEYIYCIQTDNFIPLSEIAITRMFYLPKSEDLPIANTIYAIEVTNAGMSGILRLEGVENTLRFIDLLNKVRSVSIPLGTQHISTEVFLP